MERGFEVLAHGKRGGKSQHALSDKIKEKVRELLHTKYFKANDVHVANCWPSTEQ